ncbi:MAG TPA: TRL-like family protein [Bdellovibrionota bacterium]|jgi:hypothetical protein|nr:TRL-like family protein [Bdellovibrionota bacterium]
MSKSNVLVLISAIVLTSCAYATRTPLTGGIYNDTQAGHSISSNQAGNRVGQACATSILGFVATGDATIEAARRAGGITLITSVDEASSAILGVYAKHCTIVRGR